MTPRRPADSRTELAELMLPHHANNLGNVFGGTILAMIDKAAGAAAIRHAGQTCVTAQVDRVTFHEPIELGELVRVIAIVSGVGRTSLEIEVEVRALNTLANTDRLTNTCHVTMVAVDREGSPCPVPPLLLESEGDRLRNQAAQIRIQERKAKRKSALKRTE